MPSAPPAGQAESSRRTAHALARRMQLSVWAPRWTDVAGLPGAPTGALVTRDSPRAARRRKLKLGWFRAVRSLTPAWAPPTARCSSSSVRLRLPLAARAHGRQRGPSPVRADLLPRSRPRRLHLRTSPPGGAPHGEDHHHADVALDGVIDVIVHLRQQDASHELSRAFEVGAPTISGASAIHRRAASSSRAKRSATSGRCARHHRSSDRLDGEPAQ
jgi:hypothetical protein